MKVVLYRHVDREDLEAILAGGFRDAMWDIGVDEQGKPFTMSGVGFSDLPECQFAGKDRALLRVTLPVGEDAIADWEIVPKEGNAYREWCIPAWFINPIAIVEVVLPNKDPYA